MVNSGQVKTKCCCPIWAKSRIPEHMMFGNIGQARLTFVAAGRTLANFGHDLPKLVNVWPNTPKLGKVLTTFGHSCQKMAQLLRCRALYKGPCPNKHLLHNMSSESRVPPDFGKSPTILRRI